MKKIFFLPLLFISIFSQGQVTFQKSYGGSSSCFTCVRQVNDGGYIATGYNHPNFDDLYLVKTDSIGQIEWSKEYMQGSSHLGRCVQQTFDNGYIICGVVDAYGPTHYDAYLIKTNSFGDTLWTKGYGGTSDDDASFVIQTSDSGYLIAGGTKSFGQGLSDMYIIKTNAFGDTLWTRTYGGVGNDWIDCVQETFDKCYIIQGITENPPYGAYLCLLKVNSVGDTLWTKIYSGGLFGKSIRQTTDSGFIITGGVPGTLFGSADVSLIKTDSTGNIIWAKTYGGNKDDRGNAIWQTDDNGFIIGASSESFSSNYDCYLIRTDRNGDTLFTETIGSSNWDEAYSVQQTFDRGFILSGIYNYAGNSSGLAYLLKIDSLGHGCIKGNNTNTIVNNGSYNQIYLANNYFPTSTIITAPPVSIGSANTDSSFCISVDIKTLNDENLFIISPNPFSSETTIEIKNLGLDIKELKFQMYDILGRLVLKSYLTYPKSAIFRNSLPSGIYLYKVSSENKLLGSGKVIIQ